MKIVQRLLRKEGGTPRRLRAIAASWLAILASLMALAMVVSSAFADMALLRDGMKAETANLTIKRGYNFSEAVWGFSTETSGSMLSAKRDNVKISASGYGDTWIYGVYAYYSPKQGLNTINGTATVTFPKAMVNAGGDEFDLKVKISNIKVYWPKTPVVDNDYPSISQKIFSPAGTKCQLLAGAGQCVKHNGTKYVQVIKSWHSSGFQGCAVFAKVNMWITLPNGSNTAPNHTYNLYFDDLDQPNRMQGNHVAENCPYDQATPVGNNRSVNFAEGIMPFAGEGFTSNQGFHVFNSSTYGTSVMKGTYLYRSSNQNLAASSGTKDYIRGTHVCDEGAAGTATDERLGALVTKVTIGNSSNTVGYGWVGSECVTDIFKTLTIPVRSAINQSQILNGSGGSSGSGQRTGGGFQLSWYKTDNTNTEQRDYLTGWNYGLGDSRQPNNTWPRVWNNNQSGTHSVDVIPGNKYRSTASADPYHFIYNVWVDGQPVLPNNNLTDMTLQTLTTYGSGTAAEKSLAGTSGSGIAPHATNDNGAHTESATFVRGLANLSVSKTLKGTLWPEAIKSSDFQGFPMSIRFDDPLYHDSAWENAHYIFYVKPGQTVNVADAIGKGIPAGCTYYLTELTNPNASGLTTAEKNAAQAFVNAYPDLPEFTTSITNNAKDSSGKGTFMLLCDRSTDATKRTSAVTNMTDTPPEGSLKVTKVAADAGDTKFSIKIDIASANGASIPDGTYGDVTFSDGTATISLGNGESKTIEHLLEGWEYSIQEIAGDGYSLDDYNTTVENGSGSIVGETSLACTVTNEKIIRTGSLKVSKTVVNSGVDSDETTFPFTVTLMDGDTPVSGTFGTTTFDASGKATFSLKGGKSHTISGIPAGTSYTVSEATPAGYVMSVASDNLTGTITENETATVAITNTRDTGGLQVSKQVVGNGDGNGGEFSFTVTLKDGDTPMTGSIGNHTFDANGQCSFTLAHDGTEAFLDIPTGWTYTVEEAADARYGTTWSGAGRTGTIAKGDEPVTVIATNTRKVGKLSITKELAGTGAETDKDFSFTVTLKDGDTPKSGEFGGLTFGDDGKAAFTLKGGQTKDIEGIPTGWTYAIEEAADANYDLTWTPSPATGSISDETVATVKATNTRRVGGLSVRKVAAGAGADQTKRFSFTVTLTLDGQPLQGTFGGVTFDATGKGTFQIAHNESKSLDGIPIGTTYQVSEEADPDYVTEWADSNSSTTPQTGTVGGDPVTVTATNTHKTGNLTVSKTVAGEGADASRQFSFTVTLTKGGQPLSGTFGVTQFDASGKTTFTLAGGQSKTISGIPAGASYTVDETAVAGYVPTWSGRSGTIAADATVEAACTNELIRGDLRLTKVEAGTGKPMAGVVFMVSGKQSGEWHVIVTDEDGVASTAAVAHTRNTNASDAGVTQGPEEAGGWLVDEAVATAANGVWFHGSTSGGTTPKDDKGALPFGTYEVCELLSSANRGYTLVPKFEVTISKTGTTDAGRIENTPPAAPPENPEHGNTVTIYKDSDPAPNSLVKPDGTITYTLLLRNTGKDIQPRTIVRDYIPVGTDYVEDSASDGGVFVASSPASAKNGQGRGYVEWAVDDMHPREERTVSFSAKVRHDAGRYVWNTAYMRKTDKTVQPGSPENPEPEEESNTVMHRLTDDPTPPFVKTVKSSDPAPGKLVALGDTIAYTLHVTNTNQTTAENVGVFDPVPSGTELADLPDAFFATATQDGRGIGWLIPSIRPGEFVDLHFTVKVTDEQAAAGVIRNQASWEMNQPGVPTTPLGNTTNIIEHPLRPHNIQTGKQVSAYKDSDPAPNTLVQAGQEITYKIRLKHTGNYPQAATLVRDRIPEGVTYVDGSASDGGAFVDADTSPDGKAYVEWVVGEMRTGDEREVTFKAKVVENPPTYIRNYATYDETDPHTKPGDTSNDNPGLLTNEVWHTTDKDSPTPEVVQAVKSADPVPGTQVNVGDTIRYTLHVTNTGGSDATNWGVHDRLQDGLELVDGSVTSSGGDTVINSLADALKSGFKTYDNASRDTAWVIERLRPGESIDLTFSAKVTRDAQDIVQNQATWGKRAGLDDIPTDPQENTSNIVEHPLGKNPKPVLTKTSLTKGSVFPGATVDFLITVRNDGDADIVDHILVDEPETGLEYVSDNRNGRKIDGGKARWDGITLKPGEQFQVTVRCKVTATKPGKLKNVAILYQPDGKRLVAIGDAEVIVVVGVAADLVQTGVPLGFGALAITAAAYVALLAAKRMAGRRDA